MILRFDSRFDSTFFGFKIRFEDSAESSNLPNLKIRESYDSTNTGNFIIAKFQGIRNNVHSDCEREREYTCISKH